MNRIQRSALVAFDAASMYALVDDVESYPDFLPWCRAATVERRESTIAVATLHIDYRGVRQAFTTENRLTPESAITMALVRGPFRDLQGQWTFQSLAERACKVELSLAWTMASPVLARVMGPVFNQIAETMVDAFIRRAEALYVAR